MRPKELLVNLYDIWRPAVSMLYQRCQHRFVRAAELLEINDPEIHRIKDFRQPDLHALINMYETLCSRYVAEVYTQQMDFFKSKDPVRLWRNYFYDDLAPRLVARDDVVRNVLKATGVLPCSDPLAAMKALTENAELPGLILARES